MLGMMNFQGYSRLGSALYSLGKFEDAADAYEKGLQYDPTNAQMKESLQDVRDRILAGSGFPGTTGIPNLFGNPDTFTKLQADPRTRPFLNDPEYVRIISNLQKNPKSLQ